VISSSGCLNPDIKFFQKPVKSWLMLQLLEVHTIEQEVFWRYRLQRQASIDYANESFY
jgi:hypothetical protein